MRQVILKAPSGNEEKINKAIEQQRGKNTITIPDREGVAFITYLPNRKLNDLLNSLSDIEDLKISLQSSGAVALYPPQTEEPESAADVQPLSSFEIYIQGIQSVGTWFSLLGYSFVAGVIVWIGLYTSISYLLVAAMLVAPFAGPAMNSALATAAGRPGLLLSSLMRYFGAMATGTVASFLLTLIFPVDAYTPLMNSVSQISMVAVLLPLVAGFAGAVNICQSDNDSLVSGAAVGILVAASLAPPVGLLGIGLHMMDPILIQSSVFRIILQLLGIHLAATLVFYFYGKVSHRGVRFIKGKKSVRIGGLIVVALAIMAMMYWQFNEPPNYRKSSLKTELVEYTSQRLKTMDEMELVYTDVQFSRREKEGKSIVDFQLVVLANDTLLSERQVKSRVIAHLKNGLDSARYNIYPVYRVTVVED